MRSHIAVATQKDTRELVDELRSTAANVGGHIEELLLHAANKIVALDPEAFYSNKRVDMDVVLANNIPDHRLFRPTKDRLPVKSPLVINEEALKRLTSRARKKARILIRRAFFLERRCAKDAASGATNPSGANARDRAEHASLVWCVGELGLLASKETNDEPVSEASGDDNE